MLSFGDSKDRSSERAASRDNGGEGSWMDPAANFPELRGVLEHNDNLLIDWMRCQIEQGLWGSYAEGFQSLAGVEHEIGLGVLQASRRPALSKRFGFALLTDCADSYGLTPGELAALLDDAEGTLRDAVRHLVLNAIVEIEAEDALAIATAESRPASEDADAEFDSMLDEWRLRHG
jgi:hypothetical protein